MKKYWPLIIGGLVVVLIVGGFFVYRAISSDDSKNKNSNSSQQNTVSIDFNQPMCDQIPASIIESAIGKSIVKTKPISSSTSNVCQYYTDSTHFVTLRLNKLSYENQKKGQTTLGRQITTSEGIHLEHFIAIQENGLINDIVLKINDNLFITVDRSSGSVISDDVLKKLASDVSDYIITGIKNIQDNSENSGNQNQVSLQDDEGFIKNFFGLIESKKANEAVMIMTNKNTADDSTKQSWAVQFNNMNSVKLASIEPSMQSSWTDEMHQYKVTLDVAMNPNSADAPIPYYGYQNGQNTRYVSLVKEDGAWKIDSIATGP